MLANDQSQCREGVFTVDGSDFSNVKSVISLVPLLPKLIAWNLVGLAFIWLMLIHCSVEVQSC